MFTDAAALADEQPVAPNLKIQNDAALDCNGIARYNSAMEALYEFFDHTADLGLRIRAETPDKLIQPATDALYAAIGEINTTGKPDPFKLLLTDGDQAELLRDYLAELLDMFERGGKRVTTIETVLFEDGKLQVSGLCRRVDLEKSLFSREVKAITYHELAILKIEGGYEATFIVDI